MPTLKTGLTAVFLMAIAGCSAINPPATINSPTPPVDTPAIETPTEPSAQQVGELTLTLWLPPFMAAEEGNEAGLLLEQRLADFNQQRSDVEVEVRIKAERGPGGLLETMQAASTAAPNTLPDLVALDPVGLYTAALKGLVLPLDGVIDPLEEQDWYPFAIQASQIDGQFFGSPFASDGIILTYRSSTYSSPPLSWDQLIEANQIFLLPAGDGEALFTLSQYIDLGGPLTTEDGRPTLAVDRLATVLTFYRDALEQGVLSEQDLSYQTAGESWQALLNGRGQSAVSPLSSFLAEGTDRQLSASPLPTQNGQGLGISQTWSWSIVTSDPVRQAAVRDLISWLTEPEFLGPWTESLNKLPPTRSALERWDDSSSTPIATLLAGSFVGRPSEEALATLGPAIQQAVEAVLTGAMSPEAAALQASQQVQAP